MSSGYNIEDGDTCGFNATGDMVNTDPKLKTLGYYGGPTPTHALMGGSPAIDAGFTNVTYNTDQRGIKSMISVLLNGSHLMYP